MALTIPTSNHTSISLDDYVQYVRDHVDPLEEEDICASADVLRSLANNKRFLSERINQELVSWQNYQALNRYSAPTLMLAQTEDFFVRANVWEPPEQPTINNQLLADQQFSYRIPHDHNFSFLTVGYLGTGYETTIYEYDYDRVGGLAGEHVPLSFLEHTSLSEGKVMYYRMNRDVHTQEHPKELSVSINLVIRKQREQTRQHFFDLSKGMITSSICPRPDLKALCSLGAEVGDNQTADLLLLISRTNAIEDVRFAAYSGLVKLDPNSALKIWKIAEKDEHPRVRALARLNLDNL
jgi:hypothetical protein